MGDQFISKSRKTDQFAEEGNNAFEMKKLYPGPFGKGSIDGTTQSQSTFPETTNQRFRGQAQRDYVAANKAFNRVQSINNNKKKTSFMAFVDASFNTAVFNQPNFD